MVEKPKCWPTWRWGTYFLLPVENMGASLWGHKIWLALYPSCILQGAGLCCNGVSKGPQLLIPKCGSFVVEEPFTDFMDFTENFHYF